MQTVCLINIHFIWDTSFAWTHCLSHKNYQALPAGMISIWTWNSWKSVETWYLTRQHDPISLHRRYVGGLQAGVTSNIILSMPPSDNILDQVSLCFSGIVWNASGFREIIFGFLRSGSDRWRNAFRCVAPMVISLIYVGGTEMRLPKVKRSIPKEINWKN